MARNLVLNTSLGAVTFPFPEEGDQVWGPTVTDWAEAISTSTLQKGGGTFTLTDNVNFGTSYGLFSKHFTTVATNAASSGVVRLANAQAISWRNVTNTGDLGLSVDTSNRLTFNGVSMSLPSAPLTTDRVVITNGYGNLDVSSVTPTVLEHLLGANNNIQAQINALNPGSHSVTCTHGNGLGSTYTCIRRYNSFEAVGTAITYADSATLGSSFTINSSGVYAMTIVDRSNSVSSAQGISLNASAAQCSQAITILAPPVSVIATTIGTGFFGTAAIVKRLTAGDIIRAHVNTSNDSAHSQVMFSITKIGN